MSENSNDSPPPSSQIILYQTEDGRSRIEVRLENETVWLTQQLMAELFQTTYRVKSAVATRFRQWATERLRESIVKGFTLGD